MASPMISTAPETHVPNFMPMSERVAESRSPYGLPIVDSCAGCKLRSNHFFCALPPKTLAALDQIQHGICVPEGSVVYLEGQTSRGVYILCQGRAKLTITNANGKSLILKIAVPGEILGLHSAMAGRPYEATLETLQPSQFKFVHRNDFLRFMNEHPDAALRAVQQLADGCQSAYQLIRSIGLSHSVSEKLARLLLQASVGGQPTNGGIRTKLSLTHEEIAQQIGTTRESVTRILGEFKKRRLLELKGSTLFIMNKASLESMIA